MALSPAILSKLDEIVQKRDEIVAKVSNPEIISNTGLYQKLLKQLGSQEKHAARVIAYRDLVKRRQEAQQILTENKDADLVELAKEEISSIEQEEKNAENSLIDSLIRDEDEDRDRVIMEIRAGTGGEEAALFAGDLYKMYNRYSEAKGWKVELLDSSVSDMNGFKEVTLAISGDEVYRRLRYESGGHRVQRVPETEAQGRIHTSAATVAVLPEVEDVEIEIKPEDLEIQAMRAGGPGGQNVNKVESAIRITYKPTGFMVVCREQRSQGQNRIRAMAMLRAHLYEEKQRKVNQERAAQRKSQVGSGDRSERIRTYNFPQNRLTDHRANENFNLEAAMQGKLDPVVEALIKMDREERLKNL